MAGIESIGPEFESFCDWIKSHRFDAVTQLGGLTNGFEGWLKIEFLLWLAKKRTLEIGHDIGVEYRARLDRVPHMDRDAKQCDLWVRSTTPDRFHYVELKAPFANQFREKVVTSASDDLWYVSRLLASEQAATGSAVVVGVRFNDDQWSEAQAKIVKYNTKASLTSLGTLGEQIRWGVWTHVY